MSILKFSQLDMKIDIDDKYLAHISSDGNIKESLNIHIDLVYEYFLFLVKKNKLEEKLDDLFCESILLLDSELDSKLFAKFIKYLFAKSIYWHDMGKINPNFQACEEKMNNSEFKKIKLSEKSNHSKLSAYLFINHSLQELYAKNWKEDEIEIIESIIYLFGYIIAKHHVFLYKSETLEFGADLNGFLPLFSIEDEFSAIHENEGRNFSNIYDYIECNKSILFLLSKSLFSLLIISDYYATAQFMNYGNMNDLAYENFGLINVKFREKIFKELYINKVDENGKQITFNESLIDKTNNDFSEFEKLLKNSETNLNILRNKLFIEVRTNLRNEINGSQSKNLFYIEAPTGAGKTNLSVMSAVEILKCDSSINKIFYVFPFTTLITQTYDSIKKLLNLDNSQIVQLHSKAKYNQKDENEEDGVYGDRKTNFIDNQFMNYPITLLSHVKFFDILTGVSKDDNYIFHRLANSVVVIDEIQTYNPSFWSSIVYLLDVFAKHFNIKFIVMSATLPKIGDIIDSEFCFLVSNKKKYFQNPNFAKRVEIDTDLIKIKSPKDIYARVEKESEEYRKLKLNQSKKVKTIIEFITKKGADEFYQEAHIKEFFDEVFILSGTVLEPRRREIIEFIKDCKDKNILLVTTQVVEAGVDIDMDMGFKEKSLIDSDEQLAGRINRNSSKEGNKLFLFEMENSKAKFVYRGDKRLNILVDENVLETKDFDKFYNQIISKLKAQNEVPFLENLNSYVDHIKNLRFSESHIKLIDMESLSVFVPLNKEAEMVWEEYEALILNKERDIIDKKIALKELASKISQFTFSLAKYRGSGIENLLNYGEEKYGYLYLYNFEDIYSYKNGLDTKVLKGKCSGLFI